jgi:hypothetical protein
MPKQVDSHGDEICYQQRQQKEMERRIVFGVVGKILRGISHNSPCRNADETGDGILPAI